MNKIKNILVSNLVILLLLVTGCKNKTALSVNDFRGKMEEREFILTEVTSQFSNHDEIKSVFVADKSDSSYKIEFYEFTDVNNATKFFENNKDFFDNSKGSYSKTKSVNINNYSKYTLETKESYRIVSRVDNTVIYLNVDIKYKNDIDSILKEFDY